MSELENFNYECLLAHNGLRQTHGVGPLKYNKDIAREAQKFAEFLATNDVLEHSKKEDRDFAGENVAMSMKPFVNYRFSGLAATVSWYSEIKDYDFNKGPQTRSEPTGHFTQVIWRTSVDAGFGRAKNPRNNYWYVVGRYQPTGNLAEEYKNNIPPLPSGLKWDDVPIVQEHLEELRTLEYTKTRKHVLDEWKANWVSGTNSNGYYCDVTEIFTTPNGSTYNGTASFNEDPRKKPRPDFIINYDDSIYDTNENVNYDKTSTHSDDADITKFIHALVEYHNSCRSRHGTDNLKLDDNLSLNAQDWAQELVFQNKMDFSYYLFENSQVGENITMTKEKVSENLAKELVDSWYKEGKFYSYNKEPKNFKTVGHFSQLIWKNSRKLGVGVAQHRSGRTYVVCFYHPAGNVKNQFSENVPKRKF